MSLYADDTLLYLHDVDTLLQAALQIFEGFGSFSGIRINWSKFVPGESGVQGPSPPQFAPLSGDLGKNSSDGGNCPLISWVV